MPTLVDLENISQKGRTFLYRSKIFMNFPLFSTRLESLSCISPPTTFANEFIDFDYHMTSSYMIARR